MFISCSRFLSLIFSANNRVPRTRTSSSAAREWTIHLVCGSCKRKMELVQTCLSTRVCLTHHLQRHAANIPGIKLSQIVSTTLIKQSTELVLTSKLLFFVFVIGEAGVFEISWKQDCLLKFLYIKRWQENPHVAFPWLVRYAKKVGKAVLF
jgi:hypothetical protein